MNDMLQDSGFWYAVAFGLFVVVAWVFARKPTAVWLDSEIAAIRKELEQAKALRIEAEDALAGYAKKQAEAMAQAESIIEHAKAQAAELKVRADAELKAALERHEKQALQRIRMAEAEAVAIVRNTTIAYAVQLVQKTLASKLDAAASAKLIEQAIGQLPGGQPAKKNREAA